MLLIGVCAIQYRSNKLAPQHACGPILVSKIFFKKVKMSKIFGGCITNLEMAHSIYIYKAGQSSK
jgi:hypothetical protein